MFIRNAPTFANFLAPPLARGNCPDDCADKIVFISRGARCLSLGCCEISRISADFGPRSKPAATARGGRRKGADRGSKMSGFEKLRVWQTRLHWGGKCRGSCCCCLCAKRENQAQTDNERQIQGSGLRLGWPLLATFFFLMQKPRRSQNWSSSHWLSLLHR